MTYLKADTANQIWLEFAGLFKHHKGIHSTNTRLGDAAEILHASFTIQHPKQRWILARNPAINPAFALAEVVWILNGSNDADFINFWNPILPKFTGHSSKYHGAYGFRLRTHFGFDQLQKAYLALTNNRESRQVVLQIWDTKADFPQVDGQPSNQDIPCNLCSILKIRNNQLEWMQIMRSNDFYRGLPYNIVQFTTLQEVMAGWLNVDIGTYNHLSDSLHLYASDKLEFNSSSKNEIFINKDNLQLPKQQSEMSFKMLFQKMKEMKNPEISKEDFSNIFNYIVQHQAIHNILLVVGADAARRKKWFELSKELMETCTNPVFKQLWYRWVERNTKAMN